MKVTNVAHICLTVNDILSSKDFYKWLLVDTLGGSMTIEHEDFFMIEVGDVSLGFGGAKEELKGEVFNRYRVGLHHLALEVDGKKTVDTLYTLLEKKGVTILDAPKFYPEYWEYYYALYFEDPDGMKLEVVAYEE